MTAAEQGVDLDEHGIDLGLLKEVKEVRRARISAHAEAKPTARFSARGSVFDVPCEIALPCATQNELHQQDAAALVKDGVLAVAEGANMPCTPEAVEVLREARVLFGPGKAANAGGVVTSALEMQQNASRDSWTFERTENRLAAIMRQVHAQCRATAETYGGDADDYVLGGGTAGFLRVAEAMTAQGAV